MYAKLSIIILLLISNIAFASSEKFGYLSENKSVDVTKLIGPPPTVDSLKFANDKAVSEPVYSLDHNSDEFKQAVASSADSIDEIMDSFSGAFGQELSLDKTPVIYKIISKTIIDTNNSKNIAKNTYKRQRPYIFYDREPCVSEDYSNYRASASYSYPSGHTSRAWTVALLLSSLKSDNTTAIFEKAKSIGRDRVACGVHWQSDVEASFTVATANFIVLQSTNEFQVDLVDAKKEVINA